MKRWLSWTLVALLVVALAAGVWRALAVRQAQQVALAESVAARSQTVVALAPDDLVRASPRTLALGVPISGALRAVNSAVVKARVAGEVQGLTLREGDTVRAGQVVARIEPDEFQARARQAGEQADAARAQVDIAQRQFNNNQALVNQGFISATALDTSQANLAAAQASHKAALAGLAVAQKAVNDTVLRAPLSGQVSQRLAQPGERVGVDARVLEIVDLGRLELEATLSVGDALGVQVGQKARLQLEGDGAATRPLTATVSRINPSVQAGSRSVLVYLAVDAAPGLRQGQFAQGSLATGQAQGLALPLSAVRTDKPLPYVQLLRDGRVVHQPVALGARGDDGADPLVLVAGLPEGALVVRGSVGALREGTAVTLPAATAPAASAPAAPTAPASAR